MKLILCLCDCILYTSLALKLYYNMRNLELLFKIFKFFSQIFTFAVFFIREKAQYKLIKIKILTTKKKNKINLRTRINEETQKIAHA